MIVGPEFGFRLLTQRGICDTSAQRELLKIIEGKLLLKEIRDASHARLRLRPE